MYDSIGLHYIGIRDTKIACGAEVQLATVNPDLVECPKCLKELAKGKTPKPSK